MDGRFTLRFVISALMITSLSLFLISCGGEDEPPTSPGGSNSSVQIELTSDPQITFQDATGKTNVVLQFIARDDDGYPLVPEDVIVEFDIDDAPLDNESILQEDAEELSASIHFGLVLDASYSMLEHDPPAFAPMLEAAKETVDQGLELYEGRPGTFTWDLAWFAESIHFPDPSGRTWQSDDLLTIPEPGSGTSTKLFAAVTHQSLKMTEDLDEIANGANDHHIMVVFSDGADNYSWFDNSTLESQGVTSSSAPYLVRGYTSADLDTATMAVSAHPKLTAHVIGLGSDVQDDQLQAIADAGGGQYYKNPSSNDIDDLFDLVTREFATLQTHGATIPLQPGDYTFTLRVITSDGKAQDEYVFLFHAGDEDAGIVE